MCCGFSTVAWFGAEVGLREVRVLLSDVIGAVYVPFLVCGSVSCHVDATFSRRAVRVGADVKDGERCV